ncbi:hypothetical protein ElyMa_005408100 [Elysia marginata]|uniref:Uncharacterized protein n=1 Tax=Elysia marginata TaxID=1093978 RepID=A0AAV4EH73_9GAST|nr:hypothetical protein ElyMa_005408100 [Elysia marginata]
MWRDGLLLKFDEVNICTELSDTGVDITSRVNGDEPGLEDEVVSRLWMHLLPLVWVLENFLYQELPGAVFSRSISIHGDVFFNMTPTPQDVELSLESCLLAWQTIGGHMTVPYGEETRVVDLDILFPFKGEDFKTVWTPEQFKSLVMKKRAAMLGGQRPSAGDHHRPNGCSGENRIVALTRNRSRRQATKKKVSSVTWKTNIAEHLESKSSNIDEKVLDSQDTASNNPPVSLGPGETSASSTETKPTTTAATTAAAATTTTTVTIEPSGLSLEEIMRERKELAARFVSAMMAAGVVKYISSCCSRDADGEAGVLTAAQISAAEATAQAALAVHTGHLDGAAFAVIDAVRAAHAPDAGNKSRGSRSRQGKSSKTCAVF